MTASRRHLDAQDAGDLARGHGSAFALRHVRDCAACSDEVEALRRLSAGSEAPGPCPEPLALARHRAGDLPRPESVALEEHLGRCAACALDVEALGTATERAPPRTGSGSATVAERVREAVRRAIEALHVELPQPAPLHARGRAAAEPTELERGLSLYRAGDHAAAAECLARELATNDDTAEARLFLGACLLALGRASEAVIPLREAVRLSRRDPDAALLLARALLESGDVASARAELVRAARLPGPHRGAVRAASKILAGAP